MLRRDDPGGIVNNRGDIDNRLKTLFDTLRRPENNDEIRSCHPEESENPFFCLLQDDKLITEVRVVTDRLLQPLQPGENIADVLLILNVKILVTDPRRADIEFWAASREEDEHGILYVRPANFAPPSKAQEKEE